MCAQVQQRDSTPRFDLALLIHILIFLCNELWSDLLPKWYIPACLIFLRTYEGSSQRWRKTHWTFSWKKDTWISILLLFFIYLWKSKLCVYNREMFICWFPPWGGARPKLGARMFLWLSYVGSGGQTLGLSLCFPRRSSRELDQKQTSLGLNWCPYGIPVLQAVVQPSIPQHWPLNIILHQNQLIFKFNFPHRLSEVSSSVCLCVLFIHPLSV